jgi:hypothetical protein
MSMVVMLLVVSSMAGCLSGDDDGNGNDNKKEDPVLANAGTDLFGEVGDTLTLNGSASSGPIQRYTWTITGPNASSPENVTEIGAEVEHTFIEAGVYMVTLLVEGKKADNTANDTVMVHIDLVESFSDSLQGTEGFNRTYEYTVWPEVQSIELTLTYDTFVTVSMIPVKVDLDMDVWTDDDTPYATTATQLPDAGDVQTESLDLQTSGVIGSGGFTVVIRWGPLGAPASVDYILDVGIHYKAV